MSPQQVSIRRPWKKNPRLSLRKGWPYSHVSVSSTVAADCNTTVAFIAHVIRPYPLHVRMDLFLHAACRKWVTVTAVLKKSFNIISKFIYSHHFLMNPKLNLEKLKTCNKSVRVQMAYWTRLKYSNNCISPLGHPSQVYRNRSRVQVSPYPDIASAPQRSRLKHLYHSVPQLFTSSVKLCWENLQMWVQKISFCLLFIIRLRMNCELLQQVFRNFLPRSFSGNVWAKPSDALLQLQQTFHHIGCLLWRIYFAGT
jgi:hypothetical protein